MATRARRFTLHDCFTEDLFKHPLPTQPHWMKDRKTLCYIHTAPGQDCNTLWQMDTETGKREPVIDVQKVRVRPKRQMGIDNFLWSPDEKRLLLCSQGPARISMPGVYFVYEPATATLRRLCARGKPQRNAKFAPDGKSVGFVRGDDLWSVDLSSGQETRLTELAKPSVYVGRFGWVYEEELGQVDGWSYSPDGKWIAFFLVDERRVPEFEFTDFTPKHPKHERMRYPKAGDPNPVVRIGVIPAKGGPVRWMDTEHEEDGYLIHMQWTDDGKLIVQRMPRLQNRIDVLVCDPKTGKCRVAFSASDERWVDSPGKLKFLSDCDRFFWIGEETGWRQISLCSLRDGSRVSVTSGKYDVAKVEAVDEDEGLVYFTAQAPSPLQMNLFQVPLSGGKAKRLTKEDGWNTVSFSDDARTYLLTHSTINSPHSVTVRSASGRELARLVEPTIAALKGYRMQEWEFVTFQTSDGVKLNGRILLPKGFRAGRKYPALIATYGGPRSQVCTDQWTGDWLCQYLAQQGYVCFLCDGRGSGGRGSQFAKCTYMDLGHWEAHDQIEGAKYLGSLGFVDPKRIAIWGWSYGGYLSSLSALLGGDLFAACMCVASVTHWELYDSVYTEKFMRTPAQNPEGYARSGPEAHADKLQGAMLVVHGMADDNVHFQNSVRLVEALQKAGKQFETMFYPGKKHGIEGMREHIFTMLERFLARSM